MTSDGSNFLTTFMPHGHCYLWRADILWLNVISDLTIAMAYFAIPFALFFVMRRRPNTPYRPIILMFSLFIFSCGITHVVAIWTVWNGDYGIQGLSKGFTAAVSAATAIMLIPLLPKITSLQSPEELTAMNALLKQEIDSQKAYNDKLLRTEEKLRAFLQQAPDGILIVRASGMIEYSNEMVNSMFGRDVDALNGEYIIELVPERSRSKISPEHNELFDENLARSQKTGAEFIGIRADGTEFPIDIRMSPIHSENEDGELILATLRDVSARKIQEEDNRKDLMELAHELRLNTVGQMAAGLAHELNQPLTAITSNLHTAMSIHKEIVNPDPTILELMRENYESAQRAGHIIRSLRQLVRKDTGAKKLTDINNLVQTTVQLLMPEARTAAIKFELDLGIDIPRSMIDPVQIQQILVNLGRNSIEALSDSGTADATVTISTKLHDDTSLLIKIADNGPGLSPEVEAKLFQPHITSKEKGMGLGLSICKSIAEAAGGELWHEDNEPNGSEFCFTIPLLSQDTEQSQESQQ